MRVTPACHLHVSMILDCEIPAYAGDDVPPLEDLLVELDEVRSSGCSQDLIIYLTQLAHDEHHWLVAPFGR